MLYLSPLFSPSGARNEIQVLTDTHSANIVSWGCIPVPPLCFSVFPVLFDLEFACKFKVSFSYLIENTVCRLESIRNGFTQKWFPAVYTPAVSVLQMKEMENDSWWGQPHPDSQLV